MSCLSHILPETPDGGMAERCLVDARRCIALPDGLADVARAWDAGDAESRIVLVP